MILKGSAVEQKEWTVKGVRSRVRIKAFAAFQFSSFLSILPLLLLFPLLAPLSFLPSFHQFTIKTLIELLRWSVPSAEDTVVIKAGTQSPSLMDSSGEAAEQLL